MDMLARCGELLRKAIVESNVSDAIDLHCPIRIIGPLVGGVCGVFVKSLAYFTEAFSRPWPIMSLGGGEYLNSLELRNKLILNRYS